MPDSPFSDAFDEAKFYTQSSDSHHHNERTTIRVPGDWLHFASVVANSPLAPEYETVSDIIRDGFAKAVKVALDRVNDPEATAAFSVQLSIIELERAAAKDRADVDAADMWSDRLQIGHGYLVEHFFRDASAMQNPKAIEKMAQLARLYDLSNA